MGLFRPTSDSVGRTGWDVLYSSSRVILLIVLLILLIAAMVILRDFISREAVKEAAAYLFPVAAGFAVGRWLYWRFLRQYVILQVEEPENNLQREYEVSLSRFRRMDVDGILNPVTTSSGAALYRVLEVDFSSDTIRAAWCHDRGMELAAVMSCRESWESLVAHDHEMTVRVQRLEELRYQETLADGRAIASELLSALRLPSDRSKEGDDEAQS